MRHRNRPQWTARRRRTRTAGSTCCARPRSCGWCSSTCSRSPGWAGLPVDGRDVRARRLADGPLGRPSATRAGARPVPPAAAGAVGDGRGARTRDARASVGTTIRSGRRCCSGCCRSPSRRPTALAEPATGVLWYLVTYLWLVLLSPLLLALYRRARLADRARCRWCCCRCSIYAPMAVRQHAPPRWSRTCSRSRSCWILGFAHRDGDLRRAAVRRWSSRWPSSPSPARSAGWSPTPATTASTWPDSPLGVRHLLDRFRAGAAALVAADGLAGPASAALDGLGHPAQLRAR